MNKVRRKEFLSMKDIIKNKECKYYNSVFAHAHDCDHKKNNNYRNVCDINNCPRIKGQNTYSCWDCGKTGNEGDVLYQIKIITSDGKLLFVPTCSEECASKVKDKNTHLHESRAREIKSCSIQKMKWEKVVFQKNYEVRRNENE
jgi:hypothetical protein